MFRLTPVLIVAALVLGGGCAGQIPPPTSTDVLTIAKRWPRTTLQMLEHGRTLYIGRCSGCHNLYRPDAVKPGAWPAVVHDMKKRARLESAEEDAVVRYLMATSGRVAGPTAVH